MFSSDPYLVTIDGFDRRQPYHVGTVNAKEFPSREGFDNFLEGK